MKVFILQIIDRKTGKVVQEETRKTSIAFDRLWDKAVKNINPLVYKIAAHYKGV